MDALPVRYALAGDGIAIAWGECGSGPPLLYLHSPMNGHFGFSVADPDFGPYYARLAARHRLILLDHRGSGLSRPSEAPPSMDGYVADAAAVIEAAAVAPVDVFAQTSSGCWVAVELAVRRPELVARLVLFQPTCDDRDACAELVASLRLAEVNWELFTETCIGQANGWALNGEAIRRNATLWRASDTREHVTAIAMWAETVDVTETLKRISQPTLAIRRADATSFTSGRATDAAVRLIPGAAYVIVPGSSFQPHLDHPEEITSAAERFLASPGPTCQESDGAVPAKDNGLSAREREVLCLVAAGRTNADIAAALVLGVRTVERHVDHILDKLGAANRTEAAAWAVRHGLAE